jgi:hypothetical protein
MKKSNKKIVDGKQIVLAFGGTQNHLFIIGWYAVEKRLGTPDLNVLFFIWSFVAPIMKNKRNVAT